MSPFPPQDQYFSLGNLTYSTSATLGTENTNYYRTRLAYDVRGRQDRQQSPTGTITRTVFDSLDRAVSTWIGTNDTPTSGIWSPTNNTGSANMVQITAAVYDGGGVGDSDLTQQTAYPGGSAPARTNQNYYDWRDRLVATKDGVQATEDTTTGRPLVFYDMDNLSEVTATSQYDGDQVTISSSGGVPQKPSASLLRAYSTAAYDDQQRPYQQQVFSVDPSSGNISTSALTTKEYFDHRGDTIETVTAGGAVTKDKFDGVGRLTIEYTTDGASGNTWANAGSVTGDNVLQQVETTFDADSNAILVTTRQRFDNETATGSLGDPNNSPKARVSYLASWYDNSNRVTAWADVGTNGGSAYTRPSTPPAASDTVLLSSLTYNGAGWQDTSTDPRGIVHKDFYDNLARVIKSVDAYTGGNISSSSDKTTEMTYDGDNNLVTIQADQPGGGAEVTKYIYGVTTSGGSDINSNDIVAATQYPDKTTGQPSSGQQETDTVNALGQTKTFTDRNGNVHTLSYDILGRVTSDAVTTLGSGVDGAVRRLDTAYDSQGTPHLFTSYADTAGTTIVNQVQDTFNGLGQLTNEYQAHSGAVNTSTTPQVQYGYSLMSGGANNSRLTSITYPNGRILNYNYSSGVDDAVSRLTSISDNSGTLEAYSYLGAGTVVRRSHPLVGVDLTYIKQSGESNGDAGDQYTGLDRFGRVVDQRWLLTSNGNAVERLQYGYDRDSNPLYKSNLVNPSYSELYHASGAGGVYDAFNQVTAFLRGVLSASTQGGPLDTISSPSHSQNFAPDAQGNFSSVTTDGTQVNRTNNQQNQAAQVGSTTLTYDLNGNLTTDETGNVLVFDAWNRLVQVKGSSGNVVATYKYDALGNRIQETSGGVTRDLYYSVLGQVLEEQVNGQAQVQNVWSPVYVNALVERDRDPNGSGTLSERFWATQDVTWNVIALVNNSGQVVEQYVYDPFGKVTVLDASGNTLSGSAYSWRYFFQCGRYDPATGNYHFGARDLRPSLARWVQKDPSNLGAHDTNFYRVERNNPTGTVDPTGLFGVDVGFAVSNMWRGFWGMPVELFNIGRDVAEAQIQGPLRFPIRQLTGQAEAHSNFMRGYEEACRQGREGEYLDAQVRNMFFFGIPGMIVAAERGDWASVWQGVGSLCWLPVLWYGIRGLRSAGRASSRETPVADGLPPGPAAEPPLGGRPPAPNELNWRPNPTGTAAPATDVPHPAGQPPLVPGEPTTLPPGTMVTVPGNSMGGIGVVRPDGTITTYIPPNEWPLWFPDLPYPNQWRPGGGHWWTPGTGPWW
jgi:RHS repeat-associated protein